MSAALLITVGVRNPWFRGVSPDVGLLWPTVPPQPLLLEFEETAYGLKEEATRLGLELRLFSKLPVA